MRFNDNLPPVTSAPVNDLVPGPTSVHAVKPVHARAQGSEQAGNRQVYRHVATIPPDLPSVERRFACRRILQQKVLIELRAVDDRRRHNLLDGGRADHIDETA